MQIKWKYLFCFLIILPACLYTGCKENSDGRLSISGTVKLDGTPLENGNIVFRPGPGIETSAGAKITNGQYKIAATSGLLPGEYIVVFDATKKTGKTVTTTNMNTGAKEESEEVINVIPPDFGTNSKQKITIEPGKNNVLDFDIPSVK